MSHEARSIAQCPMLLKFWLTQYKPVENIFGHKKSPPPDVKQAGPWHPAPTFRYQLCGNSSQWQTGRVKGNSEMLHPSTQNHLNVDLKTVKDNTYNVHSCSREPKITSILISKQWKTTLAMYIVVAETPKLPQYWADLWQFIPTAQNWKKKAIIRENMTRKIKRFKC